VEIVGVMVALRTGGSFPDHSAEALLVNSARPDAAQRAAADDRCGDGGAARRNAVRLSELQVVCRRLATQDRQRVQMTVKETHLKVRITRPAEASSEGGLSVG
jgi:hypothetical protein